MDGLLELPSFEAFEGFLAASGPWVAGMDFPFSQPRKLIENLGWPETWEGVVGKIAGMSKAEFLDLLEDYRASRPAGDKQHLRQIDALADSRSPMMVYGVPIGRMFFEGAPRLLQSGASILPCHQTASDRIILEAYPALASRRWIGKRSYKNDVKKKQTPELEAVRKEIVAGVHEDLDEHFGFALKIPSQLVEVLILDGSGDKLDALLCAIQAAWAFTQKDQNYGIPPIVDPLEGWIVDPFFKDFPDMPGSSYLKKSTKKSDKAKEKQTMSFHTNFEQWQQMADPAHCPVCNAAPMPAGMEDIAELPHSWLSAEPVECLKGACHLISKQHVVELFEFEEAELLAVMKEVQQCARALKKVTGAVKINYEIHGNTVPHFHVHLYPRYIDDPFPGQAIDYNLKTRWYTDDEYADFITEMRTELGVTQSEDLD